MTKATLTFALPEDWEDFMSAIHGTDYRLALWNVDQRLRNKAKYEGWASVSIDLVREWISDETEGLPPLP